MDDTLARTANFLRIHADSLEAYNHRPGDLEVAKAIRTLIAAWNTALEARPVEPGMVEALREAAVVCVGALEEALSCMGVGLSERAILMVEGGLARLRALECAASTYAKAEAAGEGVESPTRADIAWLERQKDNGHCGEGTFEAKERRAHNDRIDRILAALHRAGVTLDRMAVARIIDPRLTHEGWRANFADYVEEAEAYALAKADAIISSIRGSGG